MMKGLIYGFVIGVALLLLASCGRSAEETPPPAVIPVQHVPELKDGVLDVLSDISYPPMEYYGGSDNVAGNEQGLDIDLAREIATLFGVKVRFKHTEFDRIIDSLTAPGSEGDVIMSSMTVTQARRNMGLSFVDYLEVGRGILVTSGNPRRIGIDDDGDVDAASALDDLCGLRVGVGAATIYESFAAELSARCESAGAEPLLVSRFTTNDDAVEALLYGGSDAHQLAADAYLNVIAAITVSSTQSDLLESVPVQFGPPGSGVLVPASVSDEISLESDLCGRRVAVPPGIENQRSAFQAFMIEASLRCEEANEKPISIRVLFQNDAEKAVTSGAQPAIDAYLNDLPTVAFDASGHEGRLEQLPLKEQIEPEPYGIAVRRDAAPLRDAICDAVTYLWDTGRYQELLAEHGLSQITLRSRPTCGEEIVIPVDQPIVIGTSSALTGPSSPRGNDYAEAVRVAVALWKLRNETRFVGHDIFVRSEDDGCSDAGQSAFAAKRLLSEPRLVGVIGPQCSGGAGAAKAIYEEARVVMISGSATSDSLTDDQTDGFFFRTAYRNELEALLIANLLEDHEQRVYVARECIVPPELALCSDGDPEIDPSYGEDLSDSVHRFLLEQGREDVQIGDINVNVDVLGEIERRAKEITDAPEDFDVVVFAGSNPNAHFMYQELIKEHYDGRYIVTDAAASESGFVAPVGALAEGVVFAGCSIELSDQEGSFLALFMRDEFRGQPPSSAFPAHFADAVAILLDALVEASTILDDGSIRVRRDSLRRAVHDREFTTTPFSEPLTGDMEFNAHGDRIPPNSPPELKAGTSSLSDFDFTLEDFKSFGLVACVVEDGKLVPLEVDQSGG